MVEMRSFDEICLEGVRTKEIHGELHIAIGQEAIAAGMSGLLRSDDAMVSTHRNHYHAIVKEVPLRALLAEIFEKESGLCGGFGGHMHPFDPGHNFSATGIVGSSIPIALGYAYAAQLAGTDRVAVAITGDGGANIGAFHESLNLAAAWRLPLIVVVENNRYAISVPVEEVLPTRTISERATAYGIPGFWVDGTDVEAVAAAFGELVNGARRGNGPGLLEATCYRFRGHYEGDLDLYRKQEQKDAMLVEGDPIAISRQKLIARGEAGEAELNAIVSDARSRMADLLAAIRRDRSPAAGSFSRHVFVEEKVTS